MIQLNYMHLCMDIASLKSLTKLKYLYTYNAGIDDAQLAEIVPVLSAMPGLEALSLADSKITDVKPLFQLTNLKNIWLNGNPLTADQIAELRAALPNCQIGDE